MTDDEKCPNCGSPEREIVVNIDSLLEERCGNCFEFLEEIGPVMDVVSDLRNQLAQAQEVIGRLHKTGDGVPLVIHERPKVWIWRLWQTTDYRRGPAWREAVVLEADAKSLTCQDGFNQFGCLPNECYSGKTAGEKARRATQ